MARPGPVHDGKFFYDGRKFWVVTDDDRHYGRATKSEIEARLQVLNDDDEDSRNFYAAQCTHYGLDRGELTWKMRLLNAVSKEAPKDAKKPPFAVPDDIDEIETGLRNQWHKLERKAIAAELRANAPPPPPKKGTKRKAKGSQPAAKKAKGNSAAQIPPDQPVVIDSDTEMPDVECDDWRTNWDLEMPDEEWDAWRDAMDVGEWEAMKRDPRQIPYIPRRLL